ncbi:cation:proton antiporter [Jannaschia sp. LMIT008]|uniref:cation:proton antiporter domain-containing protein n=1 Tax=Jannaschia maritima TaxID=3032585 RepID=UPI002810C50D|nr:cation:proton antiporter [Jannaschia sp. LMIT008]
MWATIDARDAVYTMVGLGLMGLTLQPALARYRIFNLPLFYVIAGFGFTALGIALVNPLAGGLQTAVIEHAAELIVIISLAGAGLAIDTPMSWRNWNPTWRLLMVAMPLTIVAVAVLGHSWLGMGLPAALLLAAALAPTDPVLARDVQVAPPGQDEAPSELALTAEAGMNDGLAFPFVYLAIHAATYGVAQVTTGEAWLWSWLSFDLTYRVVTGVVIGYAVGWAISWVIFSPLGDGSNGAWNAVVVTLASTLLSYGITEGVDGYGFLAVFFAARAARTRTRGTNDEGYEKFAHHGAEQLEAILLAILLLWLGTFVGMGALSGLRWEEVAFALALILLIRPLAGLAAMLGHECRRTSRQKIAFFGIRGMGSVFYIAYAQNHAQFGDIDAVWRVATVTIILSILIHGYAANYWLGGDDQLGEVHPQGSPERAE